MTSLSLSDAKRVKNAFGTTVNDVVLAVCAGGLRRYFNDHDEHPDSPLVAMVPVSVRAEADKGAMGNQVSSVLTSLATDLDDPVERLAVIHEGMAAAKEQHNVIGADTLTDWAEFAPPAVFSQATRLYSRTKLADRHRPLFNVTISNVPGPPFPLYSAGARLVANYPMGPIFAGAGINMTVMSYQDNLDFGLLACPDVVDDVWSIAVGVGEALEELLKAAAARERAAQGGADETTVAEAPAVTTSVPRMQVRNGSAGKAPASKKRFAKRTGTKRTGTKKTGTKRAGANKTSANKTSANKTSTNKTSAKRTGATRAGASKATTKKAGGGRPS